MNDQLDGAMRLYYHETAAGYDDYWTRHGKFYEPSSNAVFLAQVHELGREVTHFAASLPHTSGVRALDLACGTGWWTSQLARTLPSDAHIVALDWSSAMLEMAHARLLELELVEAVSLIRGDAYHLPFADHSFDGVLLSFWLGHVPAERAAGFMQKVKRVLRPGGHILVLESAPFPDRPDEEIQQREFKDGRVRGVLKIRYSPERLKLLLEEVAGVGKASARLTTRKLFVIGWAQV
ncbi:MAG: class I SAM-dependent methyltransferase [Chloroflexi bacterium]|uniref:Class I SAM-dependent methyltransferase n=1 Tax=Candidatus Chlorohelix allophototropha TaxID=3003348 RepID=A0A8T7LT08_9CHLR|nr:class I SAM-dependent methyltransferase [Chloroflexota bacterium]WJW67034.1 class I SAM-dependent methyltransferase [Chloroflexota bacterium L227-S17]